MEINIYIGGRMKKQIFILLILVFSSFCGSKLDNVDRIIEDGVEVVINHLQPSFSDMEPKILRFEEIFKIDTEKEQELAGFFGIRIALR